MLDSVDSEIVTTTDNHTNRSVTVSFGVHPAFQRDAIIYGFNSGEFGNLPLDGYWNSFKSLFLVSIELLRTFDQLFPYSASKSILLQ